MTRARSSWCFGGVWEATDLVRPQTVPMRQMKVAMKAASFGTGIGRKPNMALIFGLARWGMGKGHLPKKSLADVIDDFQLFSVLQLNGEIRVNNAFYLGDLSSQELLLLEKRLHQKWPVVQRVVDALCSQCAPLVAANAKRRKRKHVWVKPGKSDLATLLRV